MALPLDRMLVDDAQAARRLRIIAISLMFGAVGTFSILDTTAKYLSSYESPLQVAWLRYVFHVVFISILLNPWSSPGIWRTKKPGMQFLRSVLLAGTTVFNFSALQTLQLDQAITVSFTTPLLVAIFAGPILGEWIGLKRMAAIGVGFLGVLVVTRPGVGTFEMAYLLAFSNAICGAFYNIATRFVSAYDSAKTSIAITGLFGALALAPIMPFVWHWPESGWIWGLHIATGAMGAFGHYLLILAHGRAPAPILAPFVYCELVFMTITGWLVFSDVPDVWTLAGAAVVIGAGLYLLLKERTPKTQTDIVD
ncbi:DMT family transporter [Flaviflagellibacter deserti]|uniref:DMT family transporter n=1 Tax=Flaviflagellibacter deserti TaxID=2267266 RepID=A0ABV9YZH0_9HYPH